MATRADFQRIEGEFKRLTDQLTAGQITREQFDAALKSLMIQDEQGRYWTIGANTGKWYVNTGTQWVEAAPPEEPAGDALIPPAAPVPSAVPLSPAAAQPVMAATPQYAPAAPKRSNTTRWIAVGCAVILVLCICLILLACVLSGLAQGWLQGPLSGLYQGY